MCARARGRRGGPGQLWRMCARLSICPSLARAAPARGARNPPRAGDATPRRDRGGAREARAQGRARTWARACGRPVESKRLLLRRSPVGRRAARRAPRAGPHLGQRDVLREVCVVHRPARRQRRRTSAVRKENTTTTECAARTPARLGGPAVAARARPLGLAKRARPPSLPPSPLPLPLPGPAAATGVRRRLLPDGLFQSNQCLASSLPGCRKCKIPVGNRLRRGAALPSNPSARWVTEGRQRPLP